MKVLSDIRQFNKSQWQKLLDESNFASFFQSLECYKFYAAQECFEPFIFGVEVQGVLKGVIVGYIQKEKGALKGYLSRRAIINAGPLLAKDIDVASIILLLKTLKKDLSRKAIYIEIRNFFNYSRFNSIIEQSGFQVIPHLNFQIDTQSENIVNSNLGKSRKRDIKVTLRDGASLVTEPKESQIVEYYRILDNLYKTKVKTPLFPLSFFTSLNKMKEGHIILVEYDNKIVGGTVCVGIPGQPLYEWFACGEDGLYKNIHASTLATYGGIQFAVQNGYPIFDMMGAGKPDEGYGVRDFKAKFGGKLVEDGRYLAVLNSLLYKIGEVGVKIIKKIK